jgi:hypothetical protein
LASREQLERWGVPRWLYAGAMGRLQRSLDVNVFLVHRRPIVADQEIPKHLLRTYLFTELRRADLLSFVHNRVLDMSAQFVHEACARGDACFGVLHANDLVAYYWQALGGVTPFNDQVNIESTYPGQTYAYKMFTHPRYRGRRLQLFNWRYGDTELARRGYTHTIGVVDTHNFASRRALARAHELQRLGVAGFISVLGGHVAFRSRGVRQYGFGVTPVESRHRKARLSDAKAGSP